MPAAGVLLLHVLDRLHHAAQVVDIRAVMVRNMITLPEVRTQANAAS